MKKVSSHGKLKQSTRFVIICVLLTWLPLILFGVFIFVGHGFEPIIFALHLREMNRQEEPLAVGEVWEEHSFTFLLEEVTELFQDEWQASIPELHYLTMDEMTGSAFDIYFSFLPMESEKHSSAVFEMYACAYDQDGERIGSCPLPSNTISMITCQQHHYIILTTQNAAYVDVVVKIPYGKHRFYKNSYRFYISD